MEEAIKYILMPSNAFMVLLLSSIASRIFVFRRIAQLFFILAITIYVFFGAGPVSQYLLGNLEYRYPPFDSSSHPLVDSIVVLTGAAESKPGISLSSLSNASSSYRIIEAAMIHHAQPNRKIVITGQSVVAASMKREFIFLGIPENQLEVDGQADSTFDSAVNLSNKMGGKPFILVTSAGHMPRAMTVFESNGMRPIPAPTEFITHQNIFASSYLPTVHHLANSDLAIHEYLAMAWYELRRHL